MINEKVIERLKDLIDMGSNVLKTKDDDFVDTGSFQQWHKSSLAFLNSTLGSNSVHYREFEHNCKNGWYHEAVSGLAILRAAKEDIEGGYLQKVEVLVSAEVFNDFLEMAKHLLDNGYKDPSASLVGAVLEDSLRRICINNNIKVKSDDNISSLNKKIADNEIYNRLQQREIETWNKLRDYADHGYFDEYKRDNVKNMLAGVTTFLSNYLK